VESLLWISIVFYEEIKWVVQSFHIKLGKWLFHGRRKDFGIFLVVVNSMKNRKSMQHFLQCGEEKIPTIDRDLFSKLGSRSWFMFVVVFSLI
jgi:hypothetical protein